MKLLLAVLPWVMSAITTCFEDVRRGGPVDDIGAAISRIAALPIPQSNDE